MVPVARYFMYVGSVLVALLFAANWMWPSSEPAQGQDAAAQATIDAPIARIHSAQKWPDKIEFDTSKPTIVPPAPPVVAQTAPPSATLAANAAPESPLDARAEAKPNVQPAPAPSRKRVARVHHRYPRQDYYARQATSTWADANPMARSWSWNW
ncbi:MAG: hypothetical protein JO134_05020 [Xanthobacteraceae bacterium]|nr:hypothetical protein [Xanthobacteraceae bacterium]